MASDLLCSIFQLDRRGSFLSRSYCVHFIPLPGLVKEKELIYNNAFWEVTLRVKVTGGQENHFLLSYLLETLLD